MVIKTVIHNNLVLLNHHKEKPIFILNFTQTIIYLIENRTPNSLSYNNAV